MAQEINVLVVEPGKNPRPAKVKNTLDAFSEIVGGPVDTGCFMPQRVMVICREDVRNQGELSSGDRLTGTILLCGFEGDSFISLTPEQQTEFQAHFAKPVLEGGDYD